MTRDALVRLAQPFAERAGLKLDVKRSGEFDGYEVVFSNEEPRYFGAIIITRERGASDIKNDLRALIREVEASLRRIRETN